MAALVVHLMSPGAATEQRDWDAPDGSVRHRFVSWRDIPPTVLSADLIVAHGLGALVVAQTLPNVGPGLAFRPTGSTRPRRRPWSRRLRASWVVAPASRTGLANAAALGLDRDRVLVVRDDDRDAWNRLVSSLVRYEQVDSDLIPARRVRALPWSAAQRKLSRSASTRRAAKVRRRQRRAKPVFEVEVPVLEAPAVEALVVEAPTATVEAPTSEVEAPVVVPRAKVRRRDRRAARVAEVEAPVADVEAPTSEVEAPVADRRAPTERRRHGRRATPATDLDAPVAETPVAQPPVVEQPEPPRGERPVPVPPPIPEPPPAPALPEPPVAEPPSPQPPRVREPVVAAPPPLAEPTSVAPVAPDPAIAARADLPRIAAASPRGRPRMLDTGSVDPSSPGQPWFRYRRMDIPRASAGPAPERTVPDVVDNGASAAPAAGNGAAGIAAGDSGSRGSGSGGNGSGGSGSSGNGERGNGEGNMASPPAGGQPPSGPVTPDSGPEPEPEHARRGVDFVQAVGSGVALFIIGAALLAVVAIGAQIKMTREGPFLIPLAGLFFVLAAARRIVRKHPGEAWVANWLLVGYIVKVAACYFRYFTSTVTYGGGDVSGYDQFGRQFAQAWLTGGKAPILADLHQTNFVRWFTGVVYFIFGQNLVTATFVFGLLAFIGSYFWYRATVEAVPIIDKKLYMGFVMFAPSIVFWPAEVGKEALMQLGLGTMALGLSYMLRQQLLTGLVIGVSGGWLVWVVRPHLLAMVAIGAGAAYFAGRTRPREGKKKAGLFSRPLGILIMAFLIAFTIGQGAKFLGLTSFSFSSIQTELDATTASSAQGGSSFHNGGHTLNPINYPQDVLTVLIRPFPWEVGGGLQIVASAEGMVLAGLIFFRRESIRIAFRRSRESPFLMFCFVFVALYCIAFSSFANFGLLVRERSLVLAAVLVLVAVDPTFEHRRRDAEQEAARLSASPLSVRDARDDVIA